MFSCHFLASGSPEAQLVEDELEPRAGPFGEERVESLVGTATLESDFSSSLDLVVTRVLRASCNAITS